MNNNEFEQKMQSVAENAGRARLSGAILRIGSRFVIDINGQVMSFRAPESPDRSFSPKSLSDFTPIIVASSQLINAEIKEQYVAQYDRLPEPDMLLTKPAIVMAKPNPAEEPQRTETAMIIQEALPDFEVIIGE